MSFTFEKIPLGFMYGYIDESGNDGVGATGRSGDTLWGNYASGKTACVLCTMYAGVAIIHYVADFYNLSTSTGRVPDRASDPQIRLLMSLITGIILILTMALLAVLFPPVFFFVLLGFLMLMCADKN